MILLAAHPLLGVGLALGCALVWSVAVILFKKALDVAPTVPVAAINLFKNTVGIVLLGATMLALGLPIDLHRSGADWLALSASALLGLALADSLLFAALDRIGPGLLAVSELVAAPFQMTLAVLFLGEGLSPTLVVGALAVIGGLAFAARDPEPGAAIPARFGADSAGVRRKGIWLAISAMAAMSVGILLVKRPLESGNLVEVTFIRLVIGNLGLLVWMRARARGPQAVRAMFLPFVLPALRRVLLPAAVVGTYLSMLLWLGGFKYGHMSVVSVLNQMSTVFTLGLAWLVLGERLTRRRAVGSALALVGAAVIVALRA